MNQPPERRRPDRRTPARRPAKSFDPWLTPAPMPDFEPIRAPDDATTLLRSLGDPPIAGGARLAGYFSAVVERAASVATALSFSADLPAAPPDTTSDPGR